MTQVRPLMIYAELWHGTSPVLNATVTARLTRKSADVTDDVIVPLTDDGQGGMSHVDHDHHSSELL
ncbi:unnamed protein product [Darwinula stevensoni]|uniref:Uncharacterized protein n=1 Tax=Darwinula stevensoni TaxID=69355 RepID=A0A7R9A9H2_9CRUS|nr:unnamed protein product [Darwinula stevensoni]CAG0897417.1 unnamed protein product [Darwinula stevensoni]